MGDKPRDTDQPFGEVIAMPGTIPPKMFASDERWLAEHDPEAYAAIADLREVYWAAHAEAQGMSRDEERVRAAVRAARANGRDWTSIAVMLQVESQRVAYETYGDGSPDPPPEQALTEMWLDGFDRSEIADLWDLFWAARRMDPEEAEIVRAVAVARSAGRGWAEIGRTMGLDAAYAERRYGGRTE